MKLSRKTRIIGLSVVLAIILVAGIGLLIWKPKSGDISDNARDPQVVLAEQAGVIHDGQIYTQTLLKEMPQRGFSKFMPCGDGVMADYNTKEERDFVSASTLEKIAEFPSEWGAGDFIGASAFDIKKNLYAAIWSAENNKLDIKIRVNDSNEPDREIALTGFSAMSFEDGTPIIKKMLVDDTYICLQNVMSDGTTTLQIFTYDGKLYTEYNKISNFDIDTKGELYIQMLNPSGVKKYDLASKTEKYAINHDPLDGNGAFQNIALERKSNILYIASNINIRAYNAESGQFIKSVMNLATSAPELSGGIDGISVDGKHGIYCTVLSQPNADGTRMLQFYRYTIVEDLRKDMPFTLTITAPYRDEFLAGAIALYEKVNPNEKIKYDYTYNSDMSFRNEAGEEYYSKSNLRLLTGDIGDIVMTEEFDKSQAFYSDLFVDLKPSIEKDSSYSQLDLQLLNSITINEQIQGIPLTGSYYLAQINTKLCNEMGIDVDWNTAKWSDVLKLADKFTGTDKYLFDYYMDFDRVFARMIISNMPDVVNIKDKEINLRQSWFIDLIEQWKKAISNPNFAKMNNTSGITSNALICIDWRTERNNEYTFYNQKARFKEKTGINMRMFPLFLGEENANRTATSLDIYSISKASKNKEAAWKFLSFCIQEDTQRAGTMTNTAINLKARAQRTQKALAGQGTGGSEQMNLALESAEDMKNIMNSIDYLYDMGKIKEDLARPLLKYFDGTLTLEEALAKAERDIWIRLNE